jgi:hypothetical protein
MRSQHFHRPAVLAVLAVCMLSLPALAEHLPPTFDGYVTNIVTPMEFDVGSRHVLCDDKTTWQRNSNLPEFLTELRVGIPIHVDGEFRDLNHNRTFVATNVHPNPTLMSAPDGQMQGRGLIYQAPTLHPDGTGILWVDGYPLHITPRTKLLAADGSPLQPDKLRPNQWASYEAIRRSESDSTILATSITVSPNVVDDSEKKFRDKAAPDFTEPDPASGTPGEFKFGKHLALKLELLSDPQVQAYVSKIGNSLIPQYQKELLDSDPAKINFRFYVFRQPSKWKGKFPDAMSYPGGMVLIPDNVLATLDNESQLAALLSNCIAGAIEKDIYLHLTRLKIQGYGALGGDALMGFFPLEVLPIAIPNEVSLANFIRDMNQRASRIGLTYMLQQGYDIREAPFAWTIAANREERNPMKAGVPAPTMASTLMESLQLDYPTTEYAALKTDREAFAAIQARLIAADDKLPKPKNHGG